MTGGLPDFAPSPDQTAHAELYELENAASDPEGRILAAMRTLAPWAGATIVDLGCGSGYWLPGYASEAARVVGVEPDPSLLDAAKGRDPRVEVLHGSAEHIPLLAASVDVVHARFAYFWPPGCGPGLAEVTRVLRPGGRLVVVDNDLRRGDFGRLVAASPLAVGQGRADVTDAWWAERKAARQEVASAWRFESRADFEAVLRMELPADLADPWLADHPDVVGLSYGVVLFAVGPGPGGSGPSAGGPTRTVW